MNQDSIQELKDFFAWLTGSTGIGTAIASVFNWIGVNAAAIGAICSMLSLVGWFYFQRKADKKTSKSEENSKQIEKHLNEINELKRQIGAISDRKTQG